MKAFAELLLQLHMGGARAPHTSQRLAQNPNAAVSLASITLFQSTPLKVTDPASPRGYGVPMGRDRAIHIDHRGPIELSITCVCHRNSIAVTRAPVRINVNIDRNLHGWRRRKTRRGWWLLDLGIDRAGTRPADTVEAFEAKADGVDQSVATRTRWVLTMGSVTNAVSESKPPDSNS